MNDAPVPRALRDWQLERYRLNELPPQEAAAVAKALAEDTALRRRLEELEGDDRRTLDELPPRVFAAAVRSRQVQRRLPRGGFLVAWRSALGAGATVLVAAAVVSLWRAPSETPPPRPEGSDTTRIKGLRPEVLVFRKTREGAEALRSGSVGRRGDVVQLAYQAAGRRFGAILSVDGRGVVTRHLPAQGASAAALVIGAEAALPAAYQLDDAPRFEVFYFVTAPRSFELAPLLEAARKVAPAVDAAAPPPPLPLGAGLEQASFLLKKDVSR